MFGYKTTTTTTLEQKMEVREGKLGHTTDINAEPMGSPEAGWKVSGPTLPSSQVRFQAHLLPVFPSLQAS